MSEDAAGRRRLTIQILVGMAGGAVVGLGINLAGATGPLGSFLVDGVFHVVGKVFLASLKLLVVPLVFVSIVCGTAALDDATKLGRVGGRTLGLYLLTTAIAISLAILAAVVVDPGAGFDLPTDVDYVGTPAPPLTETLIQIFPTNPVKAMAEGNMLQVLVFALLFGLAVVYAGAPGQRLLTVFQDANAVILRLVMMLIRLAPYGVFCLIATVFAVQGFGAIWSVLDPYLVADAAGSVAMRCASVALFAAAAASLKQDWPDCSQEVDGHLVDNYSRDSDKNQEGNGIRHANQQILFYPYLSGAR